MLKKVAVKLCLLCAALLPPGATAQNAPPPCSSEAHSEFDFWVGDWNVTTPDGKQAGSNRIEKILGGCVVFENWTSATSPYQGKSFNTYDPITQTWNQVWVDTAGSTIHFSGIRSGNVMDMTGTHVTPNGTVVHYKMSYTLNDDGSIRQWWQQSQDKTAWETIFDGTYRKK